MGCVSGNKEFVWKQTAEYVAITRKNVEYFNDHSVAYVIIINNLVVFGDFIDSILYDEKNQSVTIIYVCKEGFLDAQFSNMVYV